jgi:hypothetical protein
MKSVVATDFSNNFDINISNIGGRVDLKVTFIQQNTEHIYIYIYKSSLRLSMWVNNQVERGKNYNMLYLYVEAVIFKIWKYTPHKRAIL